MSIDYTKVITDLLRDYDLGRVNDPSLRTEEITEDLLSLRLDLPSEPTIWRMLQIAEKVLCMNWNEKVRQLSLWEIFIMDLRENYSDQEICVMESKDELHWRFEEWFDGIMISLEEDKNWDEK